MNENVKGKAGSSRNISDDGNSGTSCQKRARKVKKEYLDSAPSGSGSDKSMCQARGRAQMILPKNGDNEPRKSQRTRKLSYKARTISQSENDEEEEKEKSGKKHRRSGHFIVCSICGNSFSSGKRANQEDAGNSRTPASFSILTESERRSLCLKCAKNVEKQTIPKGPTLQDREMFEKEGKESAQKLVDSLGDTQASNLYCCSFHGANRCGCIQNYVSGKVLKKSRKFKAEDVLQVMPSGNTLGSGDLDFKVPHETAGEEERGQFFLRLYKETIQKKEEIIASRHKKKKKGESKVPTMPQEYTSFILSRRHILRSLGLCERGCQKVLRYSNNFLHKKAIGGARSAMPRLPRTKGKSVANLIKFEDLPSKRCCPHQCVKMATTNVDTLSGWRHQAKLSQKACWKVISDMVKPNDKGHANCSKFIAMVTGCCMFTIKKVKAILLLSKGKDDWREHGLKRHWKELKEERAAATTKLIPKPEATLSSDSADNLLTPPFFSPHSAAKVDYLKSSSQTLQSPIIAPVIFQGNPNNNNNNIDNSMVASSVWSSVINQPSFTSSNQKPKKTATKSKTIPANATTPSTSTSYPDSNDGWITVTIPTMPVVSVPHTKENATTKTTTIVTATTISSCPSDSNPPERNSPAVQFSRPVSRPNVAVTQNATHSVPSSGQDTSAVEKDLVQEIEEKHRRQREELRRKQEEEIQLIKQQRMQQQKQTDTMKPVGQPMNIPAQEISQNSSSTLISLLQQKSSAPSLLPIRNNPLNSVISSNSGEFNQDGHSHTAAPRTGTLLATIDTAVQRFDTSPNPPRKSGPSNDNTVMPTMTPVNQGLHTTVVHQPISISPSNISLSCEPSSSSLSSSLSSAPTLVSHLPSHQAGQSRKTQPTQIQNGSVPYSSFASSLSSLSTSSHPGSCSNHDIVVNRGTYSHSKAASTSVGMGQSQGNIDTRGQRSSIKLLHSDPQAAITPDTSYSESHSGLQQSPLHAAESKRTRPSKSRTQPRIGIVHPHNALPKTHKSPVRDVESVTNNRHRISTNSHDLVLPVTPSSSNNGTTQRPSVSSRNILSGHESSSSHILATTANSVLGLNSTVLPSQHHRNLPDNVCQSAVCLQQTQQQPQIVVGQNNSENQISLSLTAEQVQFLFQNRQEEENQHSEQQTHQQQHLLPRNPSSDVIPHSSQLIQGQTVVGNVNGRTVDHPNQQLLLQTSQAFQQVLPTDSSSLSYSQASLSRKDLCSGNQQSVSISNEMGIGVSGDSSNVRQIMEPKSQSSTSSLCNIVNSNNQPVVSAAVTSPSSTSSNIPVFVEQVVCQQTGESKLILLTKDEQGNIVPLSDLVSQELILNVNGVDSVVDTRTDIQSNHDDSETRGVLSVDAVNQGNGQCQSSVEVRPCFSGQLHSENQRQLEQAQQHALMQQQQQQQQQLHYLGSDQLSQKQQTLQHQVSLQPHPERKQCITPCSKPLQTDQNTNSAIQLNMGSEALPFSIQEIVNSHLNNNDAFVKTQQSNNPANLTTKDEGRLKETGNSLQSGKLIAEPSHATNVMSGSQSCHFAKPKQSRVAEICTPQPGSSSGNQSCVLLIPDQPGFPRYQLTRLDPLPETSQRDHIGQQPLVSVQTSTPTPSKPTQSTSQMSLPYPQLLLKLLMQDISVENIKLTNENGETQLVLSLPPSLSLPSLDSAQSEKRDTPQTTKQSSTGDMRKFVTANKTVNVADQTSVTQRDQSGNATLNVQDQIDISGQQQTGQWFQHETAVASVTEESNVGLLSSFVSPQENSDSTHASKKAGQKPSCHIIGSSKIGSLVRQAATSLQPDQARNGRKSLRPDGVLQDDEKVDTHFKQSETMQTISNTPMLNINPSNLMNKFSSKHNNEISSLTDKSLMQTPSNISSSRNEPTYISSKIVIDITEDSSSSSSSPLPDHESEQLNNQTLTPQFSPISSKRPGEGISSAHSSFSDKINQLSIMPLQQQKMMAHNIAIQTTQLENHMKTSQYMSTGFNLQKAGQGDHQKLTAQNTDTVQNIHDQTASYPNQKVLSVQSNGNPQAVWKDQEGSSMPMYQSSNTSRLSNQNILPPSDIQNRMRTTSETEARWQSGRSSHTLNKPVPHRVKSCSESETVHASPKSFQGVGSAGVNQRPGSLVRPASASSFNSSSSVKFFRDNNTSDNSFGPPNVTILSPIHPKDKQSFKCGHLASISNHTFDIGPQPVFDKNLPIPKSPLSSSSSKMSTDTSMQREEINLRSNETSTNIFPLTNMSTVSVSVNNQSKGQPLNINTLSNISVCDGNVIPVQSGPFAAGSIVSPVAFRPPTSQVKSTPTTTTKPRTRSKPKTIRDILNSQQTQQGNDSQMSPANQNASHFSQSFTTGKSSTDISHSVLLHPSQITSAPTDRESSSQSIKLQQEIPGPQTQIMLNNMNPKNPVVKTKQGSDSPSVYCVQNPDGTLLLLSSTNLNLGSEILTSASQGKSSKKQPLLLPKDNVGLESKNLEQSFEMRGATDGGGAGGSGIFPDRHGSTGKETIMMDNKTPAAGTTVRKTQGNELLTNVNVEGGTRSISLQSHAELPLIGQPAVASSYLQQIPYNNGIGTVSGAQSNRGNPSPLREKLGEKVLTSSVSHSNSSSRVTSVVSADSNVLLGRVGVPNMDKTGMEAKQMKPNFVSTSQKQPQHHSSELRTLLQGGPVKTAGDKLSGKDCISSQKGNFSSTDSTSKEDHGRHKSKEEIQRPQAASLHSVALSHDFQLVPNAVRFPVDLNAGGKGRDLPLLSHHLHQTHASPDDASYPLNTSSSQTTTNKPTLSNIIQKGLTKSTNYEPINNIGQVPGTIAYEDTLFHDFYKNGVKGKGKSPKHDPSSLGITSKAMDVKTSTSDSVEEVLPGKKSKGGRRKSVSQHQLDPSASETAHPKTSSQLKSGLFETEESSTDSQISASNPKDRISCVIESMYHNPYSSGENQSQVNVHHFTPDQAVWREHGGGSGIHMDSLHPPPPYPHDKYKIAVVGREAKKRKMVECESSQQSSHMIHGNEANKQSNVSAGPPGRHPYEGWKPKKQKSRQEKGKKNENRSFNSAEMKKRVQFSDTVTRESHQGISDSRPPKQMSTPVRALPLVAESSPQVEQRKEIVEGIEPFVSDVQSVVYEDHFPPKYSKLGEQNTEYPLSGQRDSTLLVTNTANGKFSSPEIPGNQPSTLYEYNKLKTLQYYLELPQHHKPTHSYYEDSFNPKVLTVASEPIPISSASHLQATTAAQNSTDFNQSSSQPPVSEYHRSWSGVPHSLVERSPLSKREKESIISFAGDRDKLHRPSPIIKAHPDKLTNVVELDHSRFISPERSVDKNEEDSRQQEGLRQPWEAALSERKTPFQIISPHGYNKLSERYLHSGKEDRNIVASSPVSHSYSPRGHRPILRPSASTSSDYVEETRTIAGETNHDESANSKIHNAVNIINSEESIGRMASDSPLLRQRALENDFGIAQQMNQQQQQQRSRHPSHEIIRLSEAISSPHPCSSKFSSPLELDRLPEPSMTIQDLFTNDSPIYRDTWQLLEENYMLKQQVIKGEHRHRKLSAMDRLKTGESVEGELPGKHSSVPSSPSALAAYSPNRDIGRLSGYLDYLHSYGRHFSQESRSRNPSGSHSVATRRLDLDIGTLRSIYQVDHSSSPLDPHIINPPGVFRPLSSNQEEDSQDPLLRAMVSQRGQNADSSEYDSQARHRNLSSSSLKSNFNEGEFDFSSRSRNPSASSLFRSLESSFSAMRSRNPSGSSNRRSRPGSSSSDRDPFANLGLDEHDILNLLHNSISPSNF